MFSKQKTTDVVVGTAPSLISSDMEISGNVSAKGEIQVDGSVDGKIQATVIVIGKSGNVTGELVGRKITIRGTVKGPVRAIEVNLGRTANVESDIAHASLEIESGAVFEGTIRRSENPIEDVQKQLTGPSDTVDADEETGSVSESDTGKSADQ